MSKAKVMIRLTSISNKELRLKRSKMTSLEKEKKSLIKQTKNIIKVTP